MSGTPLMCRFDVELTAVPGDVEVDGRWHTRAPFAVRMKGLANHFNGAGRRDRLPQR